MTEVGFFDEQKSRFHRPVGFNFVAFLIRKLIRMARRTTVTFNTMTMTKLSCGFFDLPVAASRPCLCERLRWWSMTNIGVFLWSNLGSAYLFIHLQRMKKLPYRKIDENAFESSISSEWLFQESTHFISNIYGLIEETNSMAWGFFLHEILISRESWAEQKFGYEHISSSIYERMWYMHSGRVLFFAFARKFFFCSLTIYNPPIHYFSVSKTSFCVCVFRTRWKGNMPSKSCSNTHRSQLISGKSRWKLKP